MIHRPDNIAYPTEAHDRICELEQESFWFIHRKHCISQLLQTLSNPHEIWDIGAGTGFISEHLQNEGYSVVPVEPDPSGLFHCQKRGLAQVRKESIHSSSFPAKSMETILLLDVLEHIEEDEAFLHRLHELQKDAGHIILTVPALPSLWSQADDEAGHFRRYTRTGLRNLIEKEGWKVLFLSYFFSLLPPLIWIKRKN